MPNHSCLMDCGQLAELEIEKIHHTMDQRLTTLSSYLQRVAFLIEVPEPVINEDVLTSANSRGLILHKASRVMIIPLNLIHVCRLTKINHFKNTLYVIDYYLLLVLTL